MDSPLVTGFQLDRRWHWLRGEMERSKEPDLALIAKVLGQSGAGYAVIDGIALQVHQEEPRTTLDIDVAVAKRDEIPRDSLAAAGFRETGRHAHSDNWIGPHGTPVQFTDDPHLVMSLSRAIEIRIGDVAIKVLDKPDLLHEKLRAGRDPARRQSKRLQDLADAQSLLEHDPALERELTSEEKDLLKSLPA